MAGKDKGGSDSWKKEPALSLKGERGAKKDQAGPARRTVKHDAGVVAPEDESGGEPCRRRRPLSGVCP